MDANAVYKTNKIQWKRGCDQFKILLLFVFVVLAKYRNSREPCMHKDQKTRDEKHVFIWQSQPSE